jgi:hypothetical protein
MFKAKPIKVVLGILATLLVGALSNGLWEIMKPGLTWVVSGTLDIATLGLATSRDAIYVDVAHGTFERASEQVFSTLIGILMAISIFGLMIRLHKAKSKSQPDAGAQSEALGGIYFFSATVLMVLFVLDVRLIYIVRASNHMEQMQRVVAPYIDEPTRLLYSSRFASMQSRAEYLSLQSELAAIARANHVHVPDFNIY